MIPFSLTDNWGTELWQVWNSSCLWRKLSIIVHCGRLRHVYFCDNSGKYWPIFGNFFTAMYNNELRNKNLLKFLPHLKSVATLSCQISGDNFIFQQDCTCAQGAWHNCTFTPRDARLYFSWPVAPKQPRCEPRGL